MPPVDWTQAWTATGAYLDALCGAAGLDRAALHRQQVTVTVADADAAVTLTVTAEHTRAAELVDDAELSAVEAALADPR